MAAAAAAAPTAPDLECPVCMETMLPPLLQCANGHHLCQRCTTRIQKTKRCFCNKPTCKDYGVKCPVCRVDIAADKVREDKELEGRALGDAATLHACNYTPACAFMGTYAALVAHAATCVHKKAADTRELAAVAAEQRQHENTVRQAMTVVDGLAGLLSVRRARRSAQDAPYRVRGINIPVAVVGPSAFDLATDLIAQAFAAAIMENDAEAHASGDEEDDDDADSSD
jgi:hypothetical protein